jgi:hypothetical protein
MGNTVIHPKANAAAFPGFEAPEQTDPQAFAAASSANPNEAYNRQPTNREVLAHQALLLSGLGALRVRNNSGSNMTAGQLVRISGLAGVIEEGDDSAQCSGWAVYGATLRNTSSGRLYWTLTDASGTRTVKLYSRKNHDTVANDYFSSSNLVASGSRSGDGAITLTEQNSSGITGAVTVAYTADDEDLANILHVYVFDVVLADSDAEDTFAQFVLQDAIDDGDMGYVFTHAVLTGIDTSGCSAAGSRVYLSGTAGGWSAAAGTYKQDVGLCLIKDATNGVLLLAPGGLNPWAWSERLKLGSLADVDLTGLADEDLIYYDAGTTSWKALSPDGTTIEVDTGAIRIKDGGVSLAKIVDATAQGKILGRATAGSGDFEEVAVDGTTLEFPAAGSIQIKNGGVSLAKIVDATAQGKILGRATAGSGDFEEVAVDGTTLEFPAAGSIQIKNGGVSAAKLADAVADEILTASLAVGAEGGSSDISITIQIKDAQGNSLSKEVLLEAWVADGTTGWECTTAPNGGVTVTTGVAADVPTAGKRLRCVTNTSGQAVIKLIDSGTPTYYLRVSVGGKVYTSAAITFA